MNVNVKQDFMVLKIICIYKVVKYFILLIVGYIIIIFINNFMSMSIIYIQYFICISIFDFDMNILFKINMYFFGLIEFGIFGIYIF